MQTLRPRKLVWRGKVRADAWLFSPSLIGEDEARARLLERWALGAQAHRLEAGWLLILAEASAQDASAAPGLPLVYEGGTWWGLPLDTDERALLGNVVGSVITASAHRCRVERLSSATEIDPSAWIDLDPWSYTGVRDLGAPPVVVEMASPDVEVHARQSLLGDDTVPDGLEDLAQGLHTRPSVADPAAAEPSALEKAGQSLRRWFGLREPSSGAASSAGLSGWAVRQPAKSRGAFDTWLDRFRAEAAKALLRSPVGRALSRSQAEYLQKMMNMFEQGDLDQALKHAIGLGGKSEGAPRPTLGVPTPRGDLRFSLETPAASGGSFFADDDLFSYLRSLYRRAFERLKAAGRVREAAYVLIDLLGEIDEAVEYLEANGRLRLAAEVAEARELPAGRIVRQWWLAGDYARALAVARRTGAYFQAIQLLQSHPQEAARLRVLWADALAAAGDLLSAADIISANPGSLDLVIAYLERALASGGAQAAHAVVRLTQLLPDGFNRWRHVVQAMTATEDLELAPSRAALVESMAAQTTSSPALDALIRPVLRSALRDAATGTALARPASIARLARTGKASELQADLPPLPSSAHLPLWRRKETLKLNLASTDRGVLAPRDAVFLQRGGFLLALGEAGLRHIGLDGAVQGHWSIPSEHLAASEHGGVALSAVRRGEVWSVTRLSLGVGVETLFEVKADLLAPWTDGTRLIVARGEEVLALDLQEKRPKALWRVSDVGGRICGLRCAPGEMAFIVEQTRERWRFELPTLTLRSRDALAEPAEGSPSVVVDACAGLGAEPCASFILDGEEGLRAESVGLQAEDGTRDGSSMFVRGKEDDLEMGTVHVDAELSVWTRLRACGVSIEAMSMVAPPQTPKLQILLGGAKRVRARVDAGYLVIVDDCGRLLSVDLARGLLARDLRLR